MTYKEFLKLNPCKQGISYVNSKGNDVRKAWDECNDIDNLLWLVNKSTKRADLLVVFAEECAGRALTYASAASSAAYAASTAASTAAYAAYAAYAAASTAASAAAYAAYAASTATTAAYAAADAADAAYAAAYAAADAAERQIQADRIKEIFTDLIFN